MAKKSYRSIASVYPSMKTEKRISIPQSVWRPVTLRAKDIVRTEYLKTDPHWFITHRRGIKRPKIGEDPLEARAVSKSSVKGTLPERIVYKSLIKDFHFAAGADFDFQSSLQGGRMELGGIVADFLFEHLKLVIQVQGPTHTGFLRHAKDEEQRSALEEMGYDVAEIEADVIYNESWFDNWMRRLFGLRASASGSGHVPSPYGWSDDTIDWTEATELAIIINNKLDMILV